MSVLAEDSNLERDHRTPRPAIAAVEDGRTRFIPEVEPIVEGLLSLLANLLIIEFRAELPKTPVGKLSKKELKEEERAKAKAKAQSNQCGLGHSPWQSFTRTQRFQFGFTELEALGWGPGFTLQGDGACVAWQAIEIGAIETGEGFELRQFAHTVKGFSVHLEGGVSGIATRAT